MLPELSPVDLQTIRALLSTKTSQEISDIIEYPVEVVEAVISDMGISEDERNEQLNKIIEARTLAIEKKKKVPSKVMLQKAEMKKLEKERAEEKKRIVSEEARRHQVRTRDERKKFKTREINFSELISVKINSKTTILVKPGTDIAKIKKQYEDLSKVDAAKFYTYK